MKRTLDDRGSASDRRHHGKKRQNTARGDKNAYQANPLNNAGASRIGVASRSATSSLGPSAMQNSAFNTNAPGAQPYMQSATQSAYAPGNMSFSFWAQSHAPQFFPVPSRSIAQPQQSLFDRAVDQATKLSLLKARIPNYELPNGSCMWNTVEEVQVSIGQSYDAASDEIARLGKEVLTLRAERDERKAVAEQAKAREEVLIIRLAKQENEAATQKTSDEEEISALKAEVTKLRSKVEASVQRESQSRSETQEDATKPKEDTAILAKLEAVVKEAELEAAELRAEVSALKATDAKLRAQNATLQTSYATLQSFHAELQTEHAVVVTENAEFMTKNAALYAENTTLRLRGLTMKHGTTENTIKVEED